MAVYVIAYCCFAYCRLRNQALGIVASNNIVTIRKDRDVLDSLKWLKNIDAMALSG